MLYSVIRLSFCFYCSASPRHLHSFPTRRSSDLLVVGRHLALALEHPDGDRGLVVLGGREGLALLRRDRRVAVDQPGEDAAQDRKSTRLNSSHRCISYAVFCLKKKNTQSHGQVAQ